LTILEAKLGSPPFGELIASCLSFLTRSISLKMKFRTLDIVKNLVSVWTVKIENWTVTVENWTVTVKNLIITVQN
jgi:hypothetical protein